MNQKPEIQEVLKVFAKSIRNSDSDLWYAHAIGLFKGSLCIADSCWAAIYLDSDLILEGTMNQNLKLIESPYPDHRSMIPKGLTSARPIDGRRLYGLLQAVNPKVNASLFVSMQEGKNRLVWPVLVYDGSLGRKAVNLKILMHAMSAFDLSILLEGEVSFLDRQNMLIIKDKPLTSSKIIIVRGAS